MKSDIAHLFLVSYSHGYEFDYELYIAFPFLHLWCERFKNRCLQCFLFLEAYFCRIKRRGWSLDVLGTHVEPRTSWWAFTPRNFSGSACIESMKPSHRYFFPINYQDQFQICLRTLDN